MNLQEVKAPIDIISHVTSAEDQKLSEVFLQMIKHLYQYSSLKTLLDLTASKARNKVLQFRVQNQKFFDLDEGNCRTIEEHTANRVFNYFRTKKSYIITIKKPSYDVIIHEILHMIEKETAADIASFASILMQEIKEKGISNAALRNTVKSVLFEQVAHYPSNQRNSELFARYFQILAMSQDISGFSLNSGYDFKTALSSFHATQSWVGKNVYPGLQALTDPDIAIASKQYIRELPDIKHKWSEQKVRSVHHPEKAWSKAVKSIKDL